jgi:elongation factor 1-beta
MARMEAARKLKKDKDGKEAEKSLVVLEVKPWEVDTDLTAVWKEITKYEKEGLIWGQKFKLELVAYEIKKLSWC